MDWSHDRSLKIAKMAVLLFTLIMIAVMLTAPKIFGALIERRINYLYGKLPLFLASTYTACVPASVALLAMYRLLTNIEKGQVFITENVTYIDRIAIACFVASIICLASSFYYLPFLMLFIARGFVGLVLKVVKNVFRQAVLLQEDSDYTI